MGWLFTEGQTRRELIERRNREWESEKTKSRTIKHALRGNVLWAIRENTDKDTGNTIRYIACDLLAPHRGYGWGYKDMEECMGPYHVTCPLSFIDEVPDPGSYATEWRKRVREYHQKMKRKFTMGEILKLNQHCRIPEVIITSLRPLQGVYSGKLYRIPRRLVA